MGRTWPAEPDDTGILKLRLYVAGRSPNSVHAQANLEAICQEFCPGENYELEVIDILSDPLRAVEDDILVTPTLLKLSEPTIQIIGDLSERERVIQALGLWREVE